MKEKDPTTMKEKSTMAHKGDDHHHKNMSLFAKAKAAVASISFGVSPQATRPVQCEYRNNFGYEAAYTPSQEKKETKNE